MDELDMDVALDSGLYKLTITLPMILVKEAMYTKFFSE